MAIVKCNKDLRIHPEGLITSSAPHRSSQQGDQLHKCVLLTVAMLACGCLLLPLLGLWVGPIVYYLS